MSDRPFHHRPLWIDLWFLLDAVLVLAPPLHWWLAEGPDPVAGLPASLFYFLSVATFVALSVVVAYLLERRNDGGRP